MENVITVAYEGLKLFSATKANERDLLGEKVTNWKKKNPAVEVVATSITQSSDSEFHCVTIILFYNGEVVWNPAPEYRPPNNGRDNRNQVPKE